ncbi:TPA: apolipoprotein N-acyltransferase [Candidatus Bipolaricaulota bacterium]|nr:apolipoprotein N-acyltransferase [Candidatus Bipolaricaulota bacterium]
MRLFRKGWPAALSLFAGVTAALSFLGSGPDLLVWFALIPLFFALDGSRTFGQALSCGLLGGLAFFGTLLHWLWTLEEWIGPAIFFLYPLLILYLSLYWGVFGLYYRFFKRRLGPLGLSFVIPALWTLLELARASGKMGFTWGGLGYALYRRTELIQLAAITGVLGLSFVIVWINSLLYLAFKGRDWRPLAGAIAVFLLLFSYGSVAATEGPEGRGRALKLAIVQPNIPQSVKSDPAELEGLARKYLDLLAQIDRTRAELVVLPESILPIYLLQQSEWLEPFSGFAEENGVYLLFGTLDHRRERFYNTAALLSPQGELLATYDKVQLVPFSPEYIPLRAQWEWLGFARLIREIAPADLTPGKGFFPLEAPWGRIATPICFESTFAPISRSFVRKGADLLVTITNDAWFKQSLALPQHFSFGVFRAVETGRWFVQAANTGISGIISPRGRIVVRSGIEEEEILYGEVELLEGWTFYTRFGDWLPYLGLVYLVAILISSLRRVESHRQSQKPLKAGLE